MLASAAQPVDAHDPIADKMKAREIMGFKDEEFRMRKFFQLVVLPLAVCFALVLLLRRGFLS
jgi:hypothetical protein